MKFHSDITLIIDTPSGLATQEVADATFNVAFDLAPGEYRPDGKGGWRQTKKEKEKRDEES